MAKLPPKQMLAAHKMAHEPQKTVKQIAEELGISVDTVYQWRRKESFMDEVEKESRLIFRRMQSKAVSKMEELIDNGNFNAVKYVLDGNRYAPEQKIDLSTDVKVVIE